MWKPRSFIRTWVRAKQAGTSARCRGAVALVVLVTLTALLGMASLTIDVGYLYLARQELQKAADAAALAGAILLPDEVTALAVAQQFATLNSPGHGTVLAVSDVRLGTWDAGAGLFIAGGTPVNAMEVTTRRSNTNGNPVELFFAPVFGVSSSDVSALAIAVRPSLGTSAARFLIDNEMIDSDIPVIEDLAASLGKSSIDLISDLDGDWFIDLPPGAVLELPTGQLGDPGLLDVNHPAFPFTNPPSGLNPPLEDFLNYNEDGSWRDIPAVKDRLDPLVGVATVENAGLYPSYVDPDVVQVSPVYINDVSVLNPVSQPQPGTPAINALGLRRGLLAFKILAVGADPDGPAGSVLPNLIIEIVDPALVDLGAIAQDTGAPTQLMLVK